MQQLDKSWFTPTLSKFHNALNAEATLRCMHTNDLLNQVKDMCVDVFTAERCAALLVPLQTMKLDYAACDDCDIRNKQTQQHMCDAS